MSCTISDSKRYMSFMPLTTTSPKVYPVPSTDFLLALTEWTSLYLEPLLLQRNVVFPWDWDVIQFAHCTNRTTFLILNITPSSKGYRVRPSQKIQFFVFFSHFLIVKATSYCPKNAFLVRQFNQAFHLFSWKACLKEHKLWEIDRGKC